MGMGLGLVLLSSRRLKKQGGLVDSGILLWVFIVSIPATTQDAPHHLPHEASPGLFFIAFIPANILLWLEYLGNKTGFQ